MTAKLLIFFVRIYQLTLSHLTGRCCRFQPSCSQYMIDALKSHGAVLGLWLGLKRLCRCHPWGGSGYDPVISPEPENN